MKTVRKVFGKLHDVAKSDKTRKIVLGLFVIQAIVLVFAMQMGIPPDEDNHTSFIKYYADHSVGPVFTDQEPTWSLGDKTREVDYVYHYAMSWVLRVSPFSHDVDLHIVRLFSVLFALMTFIVLVKLWQRLGIGDAIINLSLLALTNLPMVLMISSAVNNDVLVWLGVAASTLLLVRLWQGHQPLDAALLLLIALYGGLVKRTLFPIGFVIGLLTVVFIIRQWPKIKRKLTWPDWRLVVAGLLFILGIGLFAERVGGNIYRYGTITPSCEQVQGEEACKVFWVNARNEWLNDNERTQTDSWLHGGAVKDEQAMPLPVFVISWLAASFNNIVDIQTQGWRHEVMPPLWLGGMLCLLFTISILFGLVYDAKLAKTDRRARWRLVIMVLMLLIIISQLVVNYRSYERFHVFGLALNGRYILPALLPLAALSFFYASKFLPRSTRGWLAAFVLISIITGSGLLMMVRNSQLFG